MTTVETESSVTEEARISPEENSVAANVGFTEMPRSSFQRVPGWFWGIVLIALWVITPKTLLALPVQMPVLLIGQSVGLFDEDWRFNGDDILYFIGFVFLGQLLVRWWRLSRQITFRREETAPLRFLLNGIAFFSFLYLANLLTSRHLSFSTALWSFLVFGALFTLLLRGTADTARILRDALLFLIGVQCLTAIFFYMTGLNPFLTPGFGPRAQGTFGNPSVLYTLCVLALPINLCLFKSASSHQKRLLYGGGAALALIALTLTFMRAGFLAATASLLWLGFVAPNRTQFPPLQKNALTLLGVLLCGLALLVRTGGMIAGTVTDRPVWGRLAVWDFGISLLPQSGIFGFGVGSYSVVQSLQMTASLREYNPLCTEAKNLLLNVTLEQGFLGLVVLLLVAGAYYRFWSACRSVVREPGLTREPSDTATIIGFHAGLLGIGITGAFDTPILTFYRLPTTLSLFLLLGAVVLLSRENSASPLCHYLPEPRNRSWSARKRIGMLVALPFVGTLVLGITAVSLGIYIRAQRPQIERVANQPSAVRLSQIPDALKDATIVAEDLHFYRHRGIDSSGMRRAAQVNIQAKSVRQGGSTITQQLARTLFLTQERTFRRKLQEIFLALEMEKLLSKERILELYLNQIDYGFGQFGVQAASRFYFDKSVEALTLEECVALVTMAPSPPRSAEDLNGGNLRRRYFANGQRLAQVYPQRYSPLIGSAEKQSESPSVFLTIQKRITERR